MRATSPGDRLENLLERAQGMPPNDPRRAVAAVKMFDRVRQHWSLNISERQILLGGIARSTWSDWQDHPENVRPDTRERIANLYAIDLSAHAFFAPEFACKWVRSKNSFFQGRSPIEVMLGGRVEDLITVRRYLDAARSAFS